MDVVVVNPGAVGVLDPDSIMVVRCLDVLPDDFAVGHLVPSSTNTESGGWPGAQQ